MNLIKSIFSRINGLSIKIKAAIAVVVIIVLFLIFRSLTSSSSQPQYQTAQVTKGTLVVSLTETGQVAVANKISVVTQASGIVSNVYVKSGDTVKAGDKIADVTLDTAGQQRQAQAWASYLQAKSSLAGANAQAYSLQSAMYTDWNTFVNLAENSTYQNPDGSPNTSNRTLPQFTTTQDNWLAAEADYQNQTAVIAQDQANLNNASLNYQLTSGTITAPTSGTISDLVITKGMQIGSSNTTAGSSTNTSNQAVASMQSGNQTTVSVSISEVDAPQIQVGQEATVTFDALPNKTFTGKIIGIDTTGSVSSGVVTYPAIITLDESEKDILPNMSATANIITKVDDNVLLIPSAAVQTVGTTSTVRVLNNGQVTTVPVTVGDSSDTQTEILSGLTEGQSVITSAISSGTTSSSTTSVFGGGGLRLFGGGGGGGGAARTTTTGR